MSILEGWSEQDCALRLRCSRRDVTIARLLALNNAYSLKLSECENAISATTVTPVVGELTAIIVPFIPEAS